MPAIAFVDPASPHLFSAGADYGSQTAQLIAAHGFPASKRLGAGVIDGRGIWADEGRALRLLASLRECLGEGQAISVQVRLAGRAACVAAHQPTRAC